jgi:hypothetical protein
MNKLIAAAAAGALLTVGTTPAQAGWHRHHHHNGLGGFLTGALLVGGIAAVTSSGNESKRSKQDYAVRTCSGEAESRTGGRIVDVGRVDKKHGYYTVEGLIENGRAAPRQTFSCTVRGAAIYSFRTLPGAA